MSGEAVVGVVGLGNMGGVLAARLARGGPVAGFDPDAERAAAAADAGVSVAADAAGVAAAAEVVGLSLPRPDLSRAVLEEVLPVLGGAGGRVVRKRTGGAERAPAAPPPAPPPRAAPRGAAGPTGGDRG